MSDLPALIERLGAAVLPSGQSGLISGDMLHEAADALTAAQAEIASLLELLAVAEGALAAAATALESTKGPPFGLPTHVRDALTAIRAAKEKTT